MHHLRMDLRGPDLAADLMRSRLAALGAERGDDEGRLLILVTDLDPGSVKAEVMEDVPRTRIDVERFELYDREVVTERWNLRSTTARSSRPLDAEGLVPEDSFGWRHRASSSSPYWEETWCSDARPAPLLEETRATLDAVRGRPTPAVAADRDDVLSFVVGLGRLAASGSADDVALLDAAAFLLEQGARATARSAGAVELAYERGLHVTRTAWAADRRPSHAPFLEVLEALADAAARLLRWQRSDQLLARVPVDRVCQEALVTCVRAMARTPTPVGDASRAPSP